MAGKKRIMIIAHFCDYGDENSNNRFNYLANMLAASGYEVELITSSFSHRDKKQREETATGTYKTTLIYEPSYSKNISLKRLFVSHRVMANNLKKYLESSVKPDLIYCAIPSINVSEVAAEYAEENDVPFFIDVQDLWPEAYKLILKNEIAYRLATKSMQKRVDRVYAAADQVIAVSETYAERAMRVNRKCRKSLAVYLGTELAVFDRNVQRNEPVAKKPEGEFWVGYCGTLGHSYDLSVVIQALQKQKTRGVENVRFVVIGSGPLEEQFRSLADERGVNCLFTEKLPYEKMCVQLSECDIVVNPIAKGAAQSIINKHGDYAMAGLPVINTQECEEYRQLITKYDCGINCAVGSEAEVADALRKMIQDENLRKQMGRHSRQMAEELFDRRKTYQKIVDMIEAYGKYT